MSTGSHGAAVPTVVGAFVVGGIILAVAAIVLFGNIRIFNPTTSAVVIFQGDVNGLSVGSPATFRGVQVGSVTSVKIEFDPKTQIAYIPVTLALQSDNVRVDQVNHLDPTYLAQLVARGLRAELNTQSYVTGQAEVDFDFYPGSPSLMHPDLTKLPEIPTRLSSIAQFKDQISKLPLRALTDNAAATLQSLRSLSEKLNDDLPPLIASLQSTSDRSAKAIDTATRTVEDLQGKVGVTLAAITKVAASGDRLLDQRGAELHVLLTSTNQAMLQARDVLGNLQSLTAARSPARVNVESALSDLAAATASLRGLADDVEQDPKLLLTGRRP
jgi:paraquat-inducible protein B